jgi:DNA-directed RNA polymerase
LLLNKIAKGETVSWLTPLGLPIIQPYRKTTPHVIKTLLQSITLAYDGDDLPVAAVKQKSAFPPNFVHSLDATHMFMTALKMKKADKVFASVHDSFWTHAQDIDELNKV